MKRHFEMVFLDLGPGYMAVFRLKIHQPVYTWTSCLPLFQSSVVKRMCSILVAKTLRLYPSLTVVDHQLALKWHALGRHSKHVYSSLTVHRGLLVTPSRLRKLLPQIFVFTQVLQLTSAPLIIQCDSLLELP